MSRSIVNFPKGARIVMEGMVNPGFIYIVVSGEIVIESKVDFINLKLNRYRAGDVFGFVSALLRKAHHDTLVAHTDCQLVKLSVEGFVEFMRQNKEMFRKFLSQNSEKLRIFLQNIDLFHDNLNDPSVSPEALFQIGREYLELQMQNIGCYALKKYLTLDFKTPKNPKYVEQAEKLLKQANPRYEFPILEEYVDGSGILYKKGDVIFVENEPDDYLYVVSSGEIRVSKFANKSDLVLEVVGKGEIVGEMAILNKRSRSATVVAHTDCKLLRLTEDDLLGKANIQILERLFFLIAKRFWLASQRYFIRQIEDENVKLYMQLQTLAEDAILRKKNNGKEIELMVTPKGLQEMIGLYSLDKLATKEFFSDPNIKIKADRIHIMNFEDLEFRVTIMQKKYKREMGDVHL